LPEIIDGLNLIGGQQTVYPAATRTVGRLSRLPDEGVILTKNYRNLRSRLPILPCLWSLA
jgi:hypothetical protein